MNNKIDMTLDQIKEFKDVAFKNGTLIYYVEMIEQWVDGAEAELQRLNNIIKDLTKEE